MSEFEDERPMPAGRDAVFAVVSDLGRLAEWLPPSVAVRPLDGTGGDGAHAVQAVVEPRGVDARGVVRVRGEQMRVEWGDDAGRYAGYLQVMGGEPDRSSVLVHLSFLGKQPETHGGGAAADVRTWLDEALTRLERLVGQATATS
jgi:hypothetical protein